MKNSIKNLGVKVGLLMGIGFAASIVLADEQFVAFTFTSSGSGSGCPGPNNGYASLTNSSGNYWITPPAGTTSGTFTDASDFSTNYWSVVTVLRESDFASWCETNSVTFPATNSDSYQLTVFVKSTTPPPTNGQQLTLQITWH